MGMIKLPDKSINFFKNNLDEIFHSGNLAESKWNQKLEEYVKTLTYARNSTITNSNGSRNSLNKILLNKNKIKTIYNPYLKKKII